MTEDPCSVTVRTAEAFETSVLQSSGRLGLFRKSLAGSSVGATKRLFTYLKRQTRAKTGIPALTESGLWRTRMTLEPTYWLAGKILYTPPTVTPANSLVLSTLKFRDKAVVLILLIMKVSQSSGLDPMHPLAIGESAHVLANSVTRTFRLSQE